MTEMNYGGSSTATVDAILSNIPPGTKNQILQALQANGLLTSPNATIGVAVESNPGPYTRVGPGDQLAVLGPNSNTQINSPRRVVIATESGSNYVNLAPNSRTPDTIFGGSGNDTLVGNKGADSIVAGTGKEVLVSGGGKDTLVGGRGPNTITGGGQSSIVAGTGRETIYAGTSTSAHDTVQAGSGKDSITLLAGNNVVEAAPGNRGQATINAGSGYDTIYGPAQFKGAETINSGGHTTLALGTGAVTYNLKAGNGSNDTIFGGSNTGSAFVTINRSNQYTTSTSTINNQTATTYTFAGGGQITTTGNVTFVFKPNS